MDYYNDGLPPIPGQSQQQGVPGTPVSPTAQTTQSQADSTLINAAPQQDTTQSYAYTSATASQPRVTGSYYQAEPNTYGQAQHYGQPAYAQAPAAQTRSTSSGKGGSLFFGVLGGLVGALGLILILALTGVIGFKGTTSQQQRSELSGASIQISADSEDITVASAVAAKATPSVVAVYCNYGNSTGMGSGVILDADGNIITNYHVIEGATEISVTIEGKSYKATLVGSDSSSDLAVIQAELGGDIVTPIEIGDSSALVVGDWVMTVGSPFGLEQSCSQGIVSSLYRNELMTSSSGNTLYANLIQVDAAINPGNSGGALVNSQGQLVGICTLYSSDTQSFAGIGFAIPGNYAVDIANKIISGEKVTHAYIGLSMQTVTSQNAKSNNLAVDYGAYVAEVVANSPAEAAGIEVGDVIIELGGEKITSSDSAVLAVRSHSIGETVQVVVMRGDDELSFDVTLGDDTELQERQEREQKQNNTNQQYDYDYDDNYTFDQFLEELYDMMGDGYGNGNGNGNGYRGPFGN